MMPEHHNQDENYFGEEYYDESGSDEDDLVVPGADPYADAFRLHK